MNLFEDPEKEYHGIDYYDLYSEDKDSEIMYVCVLWDNKPFDIVAIIVAESIDKINDKISQLDKCVVKCLKKKLDKRINKFIVNDSSYETYLTDKYHGFYLEKNKSITDSESRKNQIESIIDYIQLNYNYDKYDNPEYFENIVYYLEPLK
ncbi:hypothetical protein [Acanthamoeba castellanii mimivirus]|uniref:Uncharacterized protein R751 n=5 Tax=Mimivirus TaxID=315393 RepID=YR751_MIMIV|nr:hypothetical protein MIMI_gp0810 [Acanthamoeba polyphaga mimivirus]Q5UP01.1 RecName: Full=Uncharacterized protein R751 [Acanthamoeba polyphaga mimivirus]AEQ60961.1 hypothetical protein [Acanthamoeba castellanii mamavirus]ALR84372.1 hypothetical protein [Niemeyer virus]AMK62031.1 hypothetical protein [Samba virus]AMZ03194.1 hypothetical protein [Mimivirus Bombay]EJN41158.1 hypothetical protein lvs_R655 [Acanthamoeba polyphaga lentillevirus]BAV61884.1 hypothetical protein [Acanthamoeba cast